MERNRIFRLAARAVMSFICCGSSQKGFSARGGMFMLTRTFRLSYFHTIDCLPLIDLLVF
jgi:hypothetical protein